MNEGWGNCATFHGVNAHLLVLSLIGYKRKLRIPEPDSEENLSSDEDMPEIPLEYAEEESSGKESEAEESREEENGRDEGEEESKTKEIKEGIYIIVRFPGKQANSDYNFVGKVIGKEGSG
ncbi:hypothetical protein Pcinc_006320 [Petrolisthes cinctipes]|uniref:Uncharacterized protein n=1 Tax=Petrolisthes cinctipes TaxID=88211 RepID=A0AAE1GDD0_PETCI|nr:hypothetical protein Pcinc_006320 [Petrolisthes cinctipes]